MAPTPTTAARREGTSVSGLDDADEQVVLHVAERNTESVTESAAMNPVNRTNNRNARAADRRKSSFVSEDQAIAPPTATAIRDQT